MESLTAHVFQLGRQPLVLLFQCKKVLAYLRQVPDNRLTSGNKDENGRFLLQRASPSVNT
jgi:hypothetical protein